MAVAFLALTVTVGRTQTCVVNWTNLCQRIDGFGASSAWQGGWTAAKADMFFSTNTGIGLSLLRNHINAASSTSATATPNTSETSIMQMAQARGALVWSAPWTPASGFKDSGSPNGGNYRGSGNNITNLNYASQLANYVASMKNTYHVNLYAISVQNEPDYSTTYESCLWNGSQIHDFVTNLNNALVAKGVGSTKIIVPESQNWSDNPGLYTPALNDSNTAAVVSVIANHNYVPDNVNGDTTTPAALSVSGKALWETEVSQIGGAFDGSIANAIYWAGRIHLFMTAAQANAWHYWWLIPLASNTDNEGLTDTSGNPAKRMYVLGQWSRFVRPGYYRIGANNTGSARISAYKNTNSSLFAIVAVNPNSGAITQAFNLTNFTATSVTPWITSATMSLSNQTPVAVGGSSFTYTLPAMSVVTFVGQGVVPAPNAAPDLTPVANLVINAGFPLQVTNVATDPNLPPQSLAFSLLSGPAGATLNTLDATNAVFAWRPLVNQANSTNAISVRVADSGSPSLSATNNFMVTVNPLTNPVIGSVTVSAGQVNLAVKNWGLQGPNYTLLTTTNLAGIWQELYTVSSTNSPVTQMIDTNFTGPVRFYRIQIGP